MLTTKEQIMLFRQAGLLLQGNFSLPNSLRTISTQFKKKNSKAIVDKLAFEVEKGQTLSRSLLLTPRSFDTLAVSLIEVGEISGSLDSSLLDAAVALQQKQNAKTKVITALIYPAIVLVATTLVVGLLIFYVLPKILPVFSSMHAAIPLTTRLLIYAESIVRDQSWSLLAALAISASTLGYLARAKRFKKLRARIMLSLPFIRKVAKAYFLAHFCRTLGQLLQKQVPIIKAVVITANSSSNLLYRQRIIAASTAVNRGQSLGESLDKEQLFPPVLKQLITVGEKTGTLTENLLFLANLYEQETTDYLSRLSIIIEPAMMLMIGGIVGFVAISIITPIYQITQNLHV